MTEHHVPQAEQDPSGSRATSPTTFVLVHGGWHNPASWGTVPDLLDQAGYRVISPQLPGHGTDARVPVSYLAPDQTGLHEEVSAAPPVTMGAAGELLVRIAERAHDRGERVVAVAHSSAGAVLSQAAQTAPGSFDHLVYLAGIVPSRLQSSGEVGALPEYGSPTMDGLVVADPVAVGALRINPRSTDPAYRALLHRKFYGDLDRWGAEAFLQFISPDQPLGYILDAVEVTDDRWGSVPRTYIATNRDQAIAPAVQTILMDDADRLCPTNPFRRPRLDSSHSPFASQPELLVQLLDEAARSVAA